MSRRTDVLKRIVARAEPLADLAEALEGTSEGDELVPLAASTVRAALADVRAGQWSLADLQRWAGLLDCCDDVAIDDAHALQILFELANPDIHPPVTDAQLEAWLEQLADGPP